MRIERVGIVLVHEILGGDAGQLVTDTGSHIQIEGAPSSPSPSPFGEGDQGGEVI